jgi:hypothetical protein
MELTDKEKGFLERFRGLESEESRDDLIFQAEAMVRAALKFDCGLISLDKTHPQSGGKTA